MLLGKRSRSPMRRTTSLTELSFDLDAAEGTQPSEGDPQQRTSQRPAMCMEGVAVVSSDNSTRRQQQHQYQHQGPSDGLDTRYLSSMAPPRHPRRNSGDFTVEPAHFLRACGLCKRRLGPGKDTFMYRGEVAFCSLECRQQQMNQDERKEKCSLASTKRDSPQSATKSEASGDGETAAAA